MSKPDNSEVSPELAKARAATGIEDGAEIHDEKSDLDESESESEKDESDTSKKSKASEEDEDEDENEDDKDDSDDDKEKSSSSKKSDTPAKNRSPLKAAFKQIGELQKGQKAIIAGMTEFATAMRDFKSATTTAKPEAKAEVRASVEDLIARAKASGADANWLTEFARTIREQMKGEFDKELAPFKEALEKTGKTATQLEAEKLANDRVKVEASTFNSEWSKFGDDLKKSYPNATEEMLTDAKTEMRRLATSKQYGGESLDGTENKGKQPMPLDYILYKEKQKFDTLLKVKTGKSGQSGGRDMGDDGDDEDDVDLTPDTMTPAKLKKFEARQAKHREELPLEIIG
jgi:hypothetical protein